MEDTTGYIMYVQVGINMLLNSAMQKMWIMVNGLQLIVLIPLIPIKMPANGQMIIVGLVKIACFDLVPVDLIWPHIFDFQDSDAFNFEFETAGYETGYLAETMGTVFVFTHFFALGLMVTGIFFFLKNKGRCCFKFHNKMRK